MRVRDLSLIKNVRTFVVDAMKRKRLSLEDQEEISNKKLNSRSSSPDILKEIDNNNMNTLNDNKDINKYNNQNYIKISNRVYKNSMFKNNNNKNGSSINISNAKNNNDNIK